MSLRENWLTHSERTNWVETSRYPETIDYCKRLAESSPWIRYSSFGISPQGRDLPLLTVAKNGAVNPHEAHGTGLPVVLIINGIHSGEIAGKEASLMLLRDIAITQERADLLDHAILLVVPIFSVDGHERFSQFNRINQVGPREMGWRASAQNLNLNRDWMKADQPEMQAMLRLYQTWLPDMVIDNHVTDGGDYEYDISYILDDHPRVPQPVRDYLKHYLEPHVENALRERGNVPFIYFEFRDTNDPAAGIMSPPLSPRFSDGYGTLQNRPSIIVETHSLKNFETRIRAHYNFMAVVLEKLNREPGILLDAVQTADRLALDLGRIYDPQAQYPISVELSDDSEPIAFRGVEYTREPSSISGGMKITYGSGPQLQNLAYYHTTYADITVAPPLGYIIPPEWPEIPERLSLHGISFQRLKREVSGDFETYRFSDVTFASSPYEGRQTVRYRANRVVESRTLPAGSAVVRLNQRTNRVILGLLEPESVDSFVAWGFLNPIFEEKEYAEPYILEKLAQQMLDSSEALRLEFEERLNSDEAFNSSPDERLRFFYDRSPYKDHQKDAYPIVRITGPHQVPEHFLE